MSLRRADRDNRSRECGPPPGYWHINNSTPGGRSRSRELPRHREVRDHRQDAHTEYERHVPDPRRLIADLGPQRVANHALECLRLLSPSQFEDIWYQLPSELRKVAYGVPPGIHVEIDSIRDESERKTMCRKINELRRERCIMLSSPAQREHWHDETWTMTPMSRETCRRFWEIFRIIPLATSNPVKWKSTLEYLKKCPETPDRGNPTRCIDASTRESPHRVRAHARSPNMRTSTPQRHPSRHESSPRGLEGLSRMARTPPTPHSPGRGSSQSFPELVRRRVEVDIANLSADDFEITRANRFPSKMKPSQALTSLPSMDAMGETYKATFDIYNKRFSKLLANIKTRSKAAKHLSDLGNTLNIDVKSKDDQLPCLLARLRATDMMRSPP